MKGGVSSGKTKFFVVGFVTFLVGGVLTATVFVPLYSDAGKERREKFLKTGKVDPSPYGGSKAGSMWKNMDREIKESKDE